MKILYLFTFILLFSLGAAAQTESLTNAQIIEMSKVGLGREIIASKIKNSQSNFDISTNALIELKKSGVSDEVISLMIEKAEAEKQNSAVILNAPTQGFSDSQPSDDVKQFSRAISTPKETLQNAKTIAIVKSSLNPSRQALEKALFKRADWKKYNLTIIRYKEEADLYIEIGRIPFTWLSHRYVFRVYDRRSGVVLTAGETTSWGSLAENMAREITQKLNTVSVN